MERNLKIKTSVQTSFFSKPMFYFSIAFLSCVALYPTLDRCISSTQDLCWQIDDSVLAIVIDTLINPENSESDNNDDDHQQTSVDFVTARMNWSLLEACDLNSMKIPSEKSLPDSAPLKKFTPPPKG